MIIKFFIPSIVVLLMMVVGTGLRLEQFRSILHSPVPLLGGTFSQVLLLPLGAFFVVVLLDPVIELAAGIMLVAACPGGALSNFYCHLGRLNVALSVLLTALSSILSFAVLPFVLAITYPAVVTTSDLDIPVLELTIRLFLFLLLPIGFGMALRHYFPYRVRRHANHMRYVSLFLLGLLLLMIIFDQWDAVWRLSLDAAMLAIIFTGFAALAGWGTGFFFGLERIDRYVFSVEFAVRNIGAAALVAALSLARPEFVTFGALFVIVQFPLIILLLRMCRGGLVQAASNDVKRDPPT